MYRTVSSLSYLFFKIIFKVCCGPRKKREIPTTTTTTKKEIPTTTATTKKEIPTTTARTMPKKKPCKGRLQSVADVPNLVLYGDVEENEEDCIRDPDAENILPPVPGPDSPVGRESPCITLKSVADIIVPYTYAECTVNDWQPKCGRHNEVSTKYILI